MNAPAWWEPQAAYVHIPFCLHHCGYCDFAVTAGADELMPAYLQALEAELQQQLVQPRTVRTLYIGGGTPTYLPVSLLERLLRMLSHWLPLQQPAAAEGVAPEFSVEATPESLHPEKLTLMRAFGVTRVSLGVQSFHEPALQVLERRHRPAAIVAAVGWVRQQRLALSLDLIFGIPGTTLADWAADLEAALALQPDHLSTYGLTYEEGTRLWKQRQQGRVRPLEEQLEAQMYELAIDRLTAAGFEHYEISNFARPGQRCRHNETYWANEAYYGFGVGAVRYVHGWRAGNVRGTREYIRRQMSGVGATAWQEQLTEWERACETLAVQLRRRAGVVRPQFHEQTGFSLEELLGSAATEAVAAGLLEDDGWTIRLTRRGLLLADSVITRLWSSAMRQRQQLRQQHRLPMLENAPQ
jgi:oxygen-independent coproporphyrinogen-3 oxidase